jgi:hypothetical protein
MTTRSCPTVTTQGVPKARCGAVLPMVVTAHGQLSPGLTYERCHLIFGTDRAPRSDSAGKTSRSPAGCRLSLAPRASNFRRPAGSTHRLPATSASRCGSTDPPALRRDRSGPPCPDHPGVQAPAVAWRGASPTGSTHPLPSVPGSARRIPWKRATTEGDLHVR